MPLFVCARTGEGVYVAPSAHRPPLTPEEARAIRFETWLRLHESGRSARDIAAVFERHPRTVEKGLAEARANRILAGIGPDPDADADADES